MHNQRKTSTTANSHKTCNTTPTPTAKYRNLRSTDSILPILLPHRRKKPQEAIFIKWNVPYLIAWFDFGLHSSVCCLRLENSRLSSSSFPRPKEQWTHQYEAVIGTNGITTTTYTNPVLSIQAPILHTTTSPAWEGRGGSVASSQAKFAL